MIIKNTKMNRWKLKILNKKWKKKYVTKYFDAKITVEK